MICRIFLVSPSPPYYQHQRDHSPSERQIIAGAPDINTETRTKTTLVGNLYAALADLVFPSPVNYFLIVF